MQVLGLRLLRPPGLLIGTARSVDDPLEPGNLRRSIGIGQIVALGTLGTFVHRCRSLQSRQLLERIDTAGWGGWVSRRTLREECQAEQQHRQRRAAGPSRGGAQDLAFCAAISDLQLAENLFMSRPALTQSFIS